MRKHLISKIQEGIDFVTKQEEKLRPVLDYRTEKWIEKQEDLPADKAFEYLTAFMQMKTESLLLLTKMQEVLEYSEK